MRGAEAVATEAWGAAAASAGPTKRLPWVAAVVAGGTGITVVTMVARGATTAAAGPGLDPPAGGGEDCLTLGRKLCPLRVFTMAGLEKERR